MENRSWIFQLKKRKIQKRVEKMEKLKKVKIFLKRKKKEVEKIIDAPEQQRRIDLLEMENQRLRG